MAGRMNDDKLVALTRANKTASYFGGTKEKVLAIKIEKLSTEGNCNHYTKEKGCMSLSDQWDSIHVAFTYQISTTQLYDELK